MNQRKVSQRCGHQGILSKYPTLNEGTDKDSPSVLNIVHRIPRDFQYRELVNLFCVYMVVELRGKHGLEEIHSVRENDSDNDRWISFSGNVHMDT
jgi:hypothetical protein